MSIEQRPFDLELDDDIPAAEIERRKAEMGAKLDEFRDEMRVVDMLDASEDQLRLCIARLQRDSWKASAEAAGEKLDYEKRLHSGTIDERDSWANRALAAEARADALQARIDAAEPAEEAAQTWVLERGTTAPSGGKGGVWIDVDGRRSFHPECEGFNWYDELQSLLDGCDRIELRVQAVKP